MVEAKAIADLEMAKNVDRDVPELVQLELGLTGVQTGRLAFAEFWLDKLIKSKNASIKASAINAKGVMAIRMERIPEAMVMFKEALAASSDYKPALLNIGFLALQGGDAATAKKALGGMQDDWYVESGLVSVLRLEGDVDKAEATCDKVLSKRPKHKPTLINCGINAWQGKKDYKKARDYLNKALAVAGGAAVWDEKSGRLLGAIDSEEARAAQIRATKEAEERKAKAEAAKPKPAPSDASGEGQSKQPAVGGDQQKAPPAGQQNPQ
jgi:tetratricopeptide (TPR) repeat protein